MSLTLFLIIVGCVVVFGVGAVMLFSKLYRKVEQGKALIVNTMGAEPDVTTLDGCSPLHGRSGG